MAHPDYIKYKQLYELNRLAFLTKTDILQSNSIQTIVPPYPSFLDRRNKNGSMNYLRYLNGGNFISNGSICLDSALGLVNKGEDEVKLPSNLQDLIYYATVQNTSLNTIKNKIISSIFKYGGALLKIVIPENVSIANALPKFEVIENRLVVDYGTYLDEKGIEHFSFIVIDTTRPIFNKTTKYYSTTKLYKVLSINSDGNYYEAEMPQQLYTTFDFEHPLRTKENLISYIEPAWNNNLNEIPVVAISKTDCTFKYDTAFIQDLIELSLTNFRLSCNLAWLENNCAASHLVIKGKNLDDVTNYPVGAGAIHVINDESASEEYLTPSVNGMDEIKKHMTENNALIDGMNYNLLNAGANSAAEALQFRIAVKVCDLVALIKNVAAGITRGLEMMDQIVNDGKNIDSIEFNPYLEFDKTSEYLDNKNIDKEI